MALAAPDFNRKRLALLSGLRVHFGYNDSEYNDISLIVIRSHGIDYACNLTIALIDNPSGGKQKYTQTIPSLSAYRTIRLKGQLTPTNKLPAKQRHVKTRSIASNTSAGGHTDDEQVASDEGRGVEQSRAGED